jgi:hypothetical protein
MSWIQQAPSWNACGRPKPLPTVPRTRCLLLPCYRMLRPSHFSLSVFFCFLVCKYLESPATACFGLPTRVSIGLLTLGESPRGHEVYHHNAVFEFVFDGVHIVRPGRFEKFVEMVFRLSRLSARDILFVGAVCFLVIIISTSCDSDPSGLHFCPFLPPLAPFLVPLPVA